MMKKPVSSHGSEPIRVRLDPRLIERDGLHQVLARLAWAAGGGEILVAGAGSGPGAIEVPQALADEVADAFACLRFTDDAELGKTDLLTLVADEAAKAAVGRGAFIASRFHPSEGDELTRLVYHARRSELGALRSRNQSRFWEWRHQWGTFDRSYIVATGPSFDRYRSYDDLAESFVITCNSAVIDREFMKYARPKLVVFGDPVFHFGPSRYASEFRARLRASAAEFDFKIAVTEKYCFLFEHCFPELMERVVFVPADGRLPHFQWRLDRNFMVKSTKNILTLLMMPVAASVSRNLRILGCDGRRLAEEGYFWGHSSSAQINDRMANIQEAHPGFFSINYNNYYLNHCAQLEDFIGELEVGGVAVEAAAHSKIPALAFRALAAVDGEVDEDTVTALWNEGQRRIHTRLRQMPASVLEEIRFVSVNPSLRSEKGHPLYQDRSLRSLLAADGRGFVSLGDAALVRELAGQFILPVFETKIWLLHRSGGHKRWLLASAFVEELMGALHCLDRASSLGDATIFCYMGHPALLPPLLHQWKRKRFRCRKFVLNLFSGFFPGPDSEALESFHQAVAAMTRQAEVHSDLTIVLDSRPLFEDICRETGIRFDVLPMCPSQTFALSPLRQKPEGGRLRIVYPSHSEFFRGFDLLVEFLEMYASSYADQFEFVVRNQPVKPLSLSAAPNIRWVEGVLSEEEYEDLLRSADIVLLPYSPIEFHYRTSSILAEAFSMGKPVIAAGGSWLALQVAEAAAGWTMPSWSPAGLREVLDRILRSADSVADATAVPGMASWCEANNSTAFFRAIHNARMPSIPSRAMVPHAVVAKFFAEPPDNQAPLGRLGKIRKILRSSASILIDGVGSGSSTAPGSRAVESGLFAELSGNQPDRLIPGRDRKALGSFKAKLAEGRLKGLVKLWSIAAATYWFVRYRVRRFSRFLSRPGRVLSGKTATRGPGKIGSALHLGKVSVEATPGVWAAFCEKDLFRRLLARAKIAESEVREFPDWSRVWDDSAPQGAKALLYRCDKNQEPSAVNELSRVLDEAGFQVWVCQWHQPDDEGERTSFYRIFPYPSLPVGFKLPTALMAFRTIFSLAVVDREIRKLPSGK